MASKRMYRCEFTHHDVMRHASSPDGLGAFKDGFWLNNDLQFTKGSDARYWIPPSKIDYVAIDEVPLAALATYRKGRK